MHASYFRGDHLRKRCVGYISKYILTVMNIERNSTLTLHTCVAVSDEHVAVTGTDMESKSYNFREGAAP
jgi:hypothetical protein